MKSEIFKYDFKILNFCRTQAQLRPKEQKIREAGVMKHKMIAFL